MAGAQTESMTALRIERRIEDAEGHARLAELPAAILNTAALTGVQKRFGRAVLTNIEGAGDFGSRPLHGLAGSQLN